MDNQVKVLLKNSEVAVDLISQFYVNVEKEDLKFDTLLISIYHIKYQLCNNHYYNNLEKYNFFNLLKVITYKKKDIIDVNYHGYYKFNDKSSNFASLNEQSKNQFQRRITGLV